MFALVVDANTGEPRRLIDTSDDKDDSFLIEAEKNLAPDEVMHKLPIDDFPVRKPYIVAEAVGLIATRAVIDEPVNSPEMDADAAMAPLLVKPDATFKANFIALAKTIFKDNRLPRFDPKAREMLAQEADRQGIADIAAAIRNGAPSAEYYVGAAVLSMIDEIGA